MFIERNFEGLLGNYASYVWIDKNIHTLLDLMWDFMRWPRCSHLVFVDPWNVLNHHCSIGWMGCNMCRLVVFINPGSTPFFEKKVAPPKKTQQCQVPISTNCCSSPSYETNKTTCSPQKIGSFWSSGTMAPWTQWWKRSPKKVGVSFLLGLLGSHADLDLQLETIHLRPLEGWSPWRVGGVKEIWCL